MELEINIGEEYKIKIEKGNKFDESIFSDVYRQAGKCVEEIILQSKNKKTSSISNDSYNNIIAFTGERGTGKSSSMISFAEALINKKQSCHKNFFTKNRERQERLTNINLTNLVSLDVIDPSLFKGEDKLFEIIISKMFSKFQKEMLNGEVVLNHDNKRDLIKQFQKVFNNLKIVHNGKKEVYDKEAIEALSDLAYGTNLKESFFDLVKIYLKSIGNNADFMLIVIDDFDLNISGAHEMLEDIRQFLIQKNIILLIACKIEQLQDSMNHEIIKNFKVIINNETTQNVSLSEEVSDKSERYLDKLLPIERRISTPSFNLSNSSNEVLIINGDKEDDVQLYKDKSIEKTILELIYRKTKHIVTYNDFNQNVIIPCTIRNIANAVTFIYREENIDAYKRLLFKGISNDLDIDNINFFKELENTPNKTLNQYIVNWIGSVNNKILEINRVNRNFTRLLYPVDYRDSLKRANIDVPNSYRNINLITEASSHSNVSYGDVMQLIRSLESYRLFSDKDLYKLYSYLKLYYSIRISLSNRTELIQLINGGMTNPGFKFLPAELKASPRDEFKIEYKPIDLLGLIKSNKTFENNSIELYYWLSFFFTHLGTPNPRFRDDTEVQHETSINKIGNPHKTVTFNSLAFIHNSLSPRKVVKRFFSEQNIVMKTQLFNDLEIWNNNLTTNSDYYNIFNFQLFDEFLSELYRIASEKNLNGNFGDDLYNFIINGIEEVVKVFKIKYPYLNLNSLLDNPIIKYWNKNLESITSLLDFIRNIKNEDENRKVAILLAKSYQSNIEKAKNKSRTIKILVNKLKEFEFKEKQEIMDNLMSVYNAYKNESKKDNHVMYIDALYDYLDSLEV
ncbi:hypothetical protein [Olleya sp. 1-3]|uniref:hypothetical protein n=1 Tax=Olleya sp. 1-3 TaxID=2058323 RepID=UPI000C3302E4|nr:hypothetical protein [Olleya sp. 1-3]PKG51035.1 hypothetical protein CXF54_10545 [Olleya sp. 1-3]